MAVLDPTVYNSIADLYSTAIAKVADVYSYYFQAAELILDLQGDMTSEGFDPSLDLLKPFYQAYLASTTAYAEAPGSVVSAVQSLQQHVIKEAGVTDVNDWLDSEGIDVPCEFARVSERAGFPLWNKNVDGGANNEFTYNSVDCEDGIA